MRSAQMSSAALQFLSHPFSPTCRKKIRQTPLWIVYWQPSWKSKHSRNRSDGNIAMNALLRSHPKSMMQVVCFIYVLAVNDPIFFAVHLYACISCFWFVNESMKMPELIYRWALNIVYNRWALNILCNRKRSQHNSSSVSLHNWYVHSSALH